MQSTPDGGDGFLSLVRERGSCRRFDPDRPIAPEVLERCLEAARLAPSACNRQPWHFVVIEADDQREALFRDCRLPGIAHRWWCDVPVFVALCAQLSLVTHRVAPAVSGIPYYLLDVGIAGEHFVLAATEAGLGTCWVGWFRERAVKRLLSIPRSVRVVSLIAVGYPVGAPARCGQRRELAEFVHWGGWGNAVPPGARGV